jgi:hypothetical protein
MKRLFVPLLFCALALSACQHSTSPSTPAQAPADGTIFTFQFDGTYGPAVITHTIRKTPDGFKVVDSPLDEVVYRLYDNGDIGLVCSCDVLELGVASHRSFRTRATESPTKYGGHEVAAWTHLESKYLGNEAVLFNSRSYDCSKIEVDGILQLEDSASTTYLGGSTTYWYSSELRYFMRIDNKQYYLDSVVSSSTMTLTSVK